MTKNEFRTNLDQATETMDCGMSVEELNFCTELLYDPKNPWYFDDFYEFAKQLYSEDGYVMYTLSQFDALPDLYDNESLVRDWLGQNPKALNKLMKDEELKEREEVIHLDIDIIAEWFEDNENEKYYKQCVLYITDKTK